MSKKIKEHTYYVRGMHCASCEVLIEKRLSALKEIKSVEASVGGGKIFVIYKGERPSIDRLNKIFKRENYLFFDQPVEITERKKENSFFTIVSAALVIIIGFFLIKNSGFAGLINVNSHSSL